MPRKIFRSPSYRLTLGNLIGLLWLGPVGAAEPLRVQADAWCPFNCVAGSAQPGYVVEMLQAAFAPSGHTIRYEIVPWSRALAEVRDGRSDAVIGVTLVDARENGLRIGREPVGVASDCVFVPASNPVRVRNQHDLEPLNRVGIVNGYTYAGFLGDWIDSPQRRAKLETTGGERPAEVNLRNLANGQLDAVFENRSVGKYLIASLKLEQQVRLSGCVGSAPIYVGFSGKHPNAAALAQQLDAAIVALRSDGRLAQLLAKYAIKEWR